MRFAMPDQHSIAMKYSMLKQAIDRPVALVGMMGSGKSLIGRRLAGQLALPFIDSDTEVETAAGISISEIFELAGGSQNSDPWSGTPSWLPPMRDLRSFRQAAVRSARRKQPNSCASARMSSGWTRARNAAVAHRLRRQPAAASYGQPAADTSRACRDTAGRLRPRPHHGEDGPPVGGGGGNGCA